MIHNFMRSIGFSEMTQNDGLYMLLEEIVNHPDEQTFAQDSFGNEIACFNKYIVGNLGITVCGNFINNDEFRMEYYSPFFHGTRITTYEPVDIERRSNSESYMGICDELKLGIPLIFHINNVMDILREKKMGEQFIKSGNVAISALAYAGKILLPTAKTQQMVALREKSTEKRMNLMQKAREGNHTAIENLTLKDMDTYASISRRILKEDILSIVESSIVPFGVESDQYSIIGEILECYKEVNPITGESLWIMTINTNELIIDLCINAKHLLGEPEIGRRFKGRVWMQGNINSGY